MSTNIKRNAAIDTCKIIYTLAQTEISAVSGGNDEDNCQCMCYAILSKNINAPFDEFRAISNTKHFPIFLNNVDINAGQYDGNFAIRLEPKGLMSNEQCYERCHTDNQHYDSCA